MNLNDTQEHPDLWPEPSHPLDDNHDLLAVTLCNTILKEMLSSDVDDSHRLIELYNQSNQEHRDTLNQMAVWLTGWTLPTLMEQTREAEAKRLSQ